MAEQSEIETALKAEMTAGIAARADGRLAEAEDTFRTVLAEDPSHAPAHTQLGHTLRALDRKDEAVDAYRAAVEAAPEDLDTLYQLGALLLELRRLDELDEVAHRLIELDPTGPRGHALEGLSHRARGDLEQAAEHLERAVSLAPADFTTRNAVMMVLYTLGRVEEARAHGFAGLVQKDKTACAAFAKSAFAELGLDRRSPPFRPTQPKRNIIAFSLWGDHPDYTHGAIVNAQIAPHLYKEWTCRFYCDDTVPQEIRDELERLGSQVVVMPERSRGGNGTFWRFYASDDAEIDRFICRDTDSRLNCREKVAVDAWIESGKAVHIMRDHVYHNELILAGMWGAVAGVLPNLEALSARGYRSMGVRHADQNFLRAVIWPLVKDDALVHDSQYRMGGSLPFPHPSGLNYPWHVGWSELNMDPWTPR